MTNLKPKRRAEDPSGSRKGAKASKKQMPLWQETILLLVLALGLAVVIKTFFMQAFYIPSGSMEPQFVQNDRILVQKVGYWFGEPQRGDIVVFEDPGGWLSDSEANPEHGNLTKALQMIGLYPTGGHLVKRVIGVGGDRVQCCNKDGKMKINGVPLDEPYLKERGKASRDRFDQRVPAGKLWVMGDNRNDSADSRYHLGAPGGGMVDVDQVVGKAFVLVWPLHRWDGISRPDSFASVPDSAGS